MLLKAQDERGALLNVIHEAARLLAILDSFQPALEHESHNQIVRVVQADAEEAVSKAPSQVPSSAGVDAALLGEAALLLVQRKGGS